MWGLTMTTGSSHYPRGHGFIERQVQIIKKLFNRCDEDSVNHQMALQELRTTLLDSNTPSPAGFLYGRQIKTALPAITKSPQNSEVVKESLQSREDLRRYDAQAKERSTVLPTQPVWVLDTTNHRWGQGVVKSKAETPRSYIAQTHKVNTGGIGYTYRKQQ